MSSVLTWAGVGVLGAAGAYARWRVGGAIMVRRPGPFPAGTWWVNLSGAFALGLLTGAGVGGTAALLVGTGLLGAYTTFSTWMVEAQRLLEAGDGLRGWGYLLGSMLAGLAATGAGWLIGGALT